MIALALDYALYCKGCHPFGEDLKFLVEIEKPMRAVTINCEFSLPRLITVVHNVTKAVDKRLYYVQNYWWV